MSATTTSIHLTAHETEFLNAQVQAGHYGSLDDVVHEAIRRYEGDVLRKQMQLEHLRRAGDEGEAAIARGDYVDVPYDQLDSFLEGLEREAVGE